MTCAGEGWLPISAERAGCPYTREARAGGPYTRGAATAGPDAYASPTISRPNASSSAFVQPSKVWPVVSS